MGISFFCSVQNTPHRRQDRTYFRICKAVCPLRQGWLKDLNDRRPSLDAFPRYLQMGSVLLHLSLWTPCLLAQVVFRNIGQFFDDACSLCCFDLMSAKIPCHGTSRPELTCSLTLCQVQQDAPLVQSHPRDHDTVSFFGRSATMSQIACRDSGPRTRERTESCAPVVQPHVPL